MATDRVRIGRNNKARAKAYERDLARRLGGKRYPADTGGACDIDHPELAIQCKSGSTVVTEIIREAMVSAKLASIGNNKLPAVAVVDRRGTRNQRYLIFDLDLWAAHYGYGQEAPE